MDYLTFKKLPEELKNQANYQGVVAKEILFQQSKVTDSIYFLIEGRIRLVSVTEERIINHYFVSTGASFAETALFADRHFYMAIAETAGRIATISKEVFRQAIIEIPSLAIAYMNQLIGRIQTAKNLLDLRSIRSARERILQYLIFQEGIENRTFLLKCSLKDLAVELGLSSEALSRNLSSMESEGIITRKKRTLTLNEDWLTINQSEQ